MGATGAAEPPGLYRVTRIVLHQQTNNNNNNHPLQVNSHSSLPRLCSLRLLPRLCCPDCVALARLVALQAGSQPDTDFTV